MQVLLAQPWLPAVWQPASKRSVPGCSGLPAALLAFWNSTQNQGYLHGQTALVLIVIFSLFAQDFDCLRTVRLSFRYIQR
jgi:hypothetical protein